MKLWIDDIRPAPKGYTWCKSVNEAKHEVICVQMYDWDTSIEQEKIELIDINHDAGNYANDGGDYIEFLKWLEARDIHENRKREYNIRIHSMNPVGVENMRRIIERNGWMEII